MSSAVAAASTPLEELLQQVDETVEVQRALVAYERTLQDAQRLGIGGDVSGQISPGVRITPDRAEEDEYSISPTLTVTASIPLGLTGDQQTRYAGALDALKRAEIQLHRTREDMLFNIRQRYYRAALALEEFNLATRNAALLQEIHSFDRLRFEGGDISWDTLLQSNAAARNAVADAEAMEAAYREEVLMLALLVGQEPGMLTIVSPEDLDILLQEITPRSPVDESPAVQEQRVILSTALRAAAEPVTPLSQISLRVASELYEHSTSASYSLTNRTLALSYSPGGGVFTRDSGRDSGSSTDWSVTAGITIGLSGIRTARVEQQIKEQDVQNELLRLQGVQDQEQAVRESAWEAVEQAKRSRERAERALEQAMVTWDIVQARAESGQMRSVDVQQAELQSDRASLDLMRHTLNLDLAQREYVR